jgi:hypothetical protein
LRAQVAVSEGDGVASIELRAQVAVSEGDGVASRGHGAEKKNVGQTLAIQRTTPVSASAFGSLAMTALPTEALGGPT